MDTPPPPPPQPSFPLPPPPPKTGKSGCLKAFLITAAVVLVLGAGCVAVGVWWWSRNGDEFMARGEAATAEGTQAGSGTDEAGCVQLARARSAADASMGGMVSHGVYLRSCLGAARETPGFCEGVPAETEFRATAEWRGKQCPGNDGGCAIVMQSVQQYCHRDRPNRTFEPAQVEPAPGGADAAVPDTGAASF